MPMRAPPLMAATPIGGSRALRQRARGRGCHLTRNERRGEVTASTPVSSSLRRAVLLLAALAGSRVATATPRPLRCDDAAALPVVVRETPSQVSLGIRLPPGTDPG